MYNNFRIGRKMIQISNCFLALTIQPEEGWFSLQPVEQKLPGVEHARLGIEIAGEGRQRQIPGKSWNLAGWREEELASPHGRLQQVVLETGRSHLGLACRLTFALAEEQPFCLWKVRLSNQGQHPQRIRRIALLDAARLVNLAGNAPAFHVNGWQSWSFSATYAAHERPRVTRLGALQPRLHYEPQYRSPGRFGSDFYGVLGDRQQRCGLLLGFLSQKQHFGTLAADLRRTPSLRLWANGDDARLDPGAEIETDWAVYLPLHLDEDDPLAPYLAAVARENGARLPETIPVGWCSWYQYYQNVTATDIHKNLMAVERMKDELPLQVVQLDDGFQRQAGDWFDFSPGFSEGIAGLAAEIRQRGLTPGLWLAPFIVHPKARLVREHPDWLLRNRLGLPVTAGYIWDGFTRALDLTHPDALAYACRVVKTAVKEWGYPYLKLDFLYAGGLPGKRRDPTLTSAQVLRRAMEAIRQAAGEETFILGCGAPLGSVVGLVEAMRIGADVSGNWKPRQYGLERPFENEPGMPAVRNALQNALTRANLHGRWWLNDPDCLLVRPETRLTLAEVQTLATVIRLSGGLVMLSDDLERLPDDRLRIAKMMVPVIGQRPRVLDWFDSRSPQRMRVDLEDNHGKRYLLAWINWEDQPCQVFIQLRDFRLPDGTYRLREVWSGVESEWSADAPFNRRVAAHGCLLLEIQPREG